MREVYYYYLKTSAAGWLGSWRWRLFGVLLLAAQPAMAAGAPPREDTLRVNRHIAEIFFQPGMYSVLEDPTNRLTIQEVASPALRSRFSRFDDECRCIQNPKFTYWLRLTVRNTDSSPQERWYWEVFDSHIENVAFFRTEPQGSYDSLVTGAALPFRSRAVLFKNFLFALNLQPGQTQTYYVRLHSDAKNSFRGLLRSEKDLPQDAQDNYILFGCFYGVLLIMMVYNFGLYLFMRERTYLHYVLYVLCCSLMFLSDDGLGFQYLWPGLPGLNRIINPSAPFFLLVALSFYSRSFLATAEHLPRHDKWIRIVAAGTVAVLLLDTLVLRTSFLYWLYLAPYILIYSAAWRVYKQGVRSARFFVAAHTLICLGVLFHVTRRVGVNFLNGPFTVYSMYSAFMVEVAVLSYALGEKIKAIREATFKAQARLVKQLQKKHHAQALLMEQLRQNQELKDQLNTELEAQVVRRTEELQRQSETIAAQNHELLQANGLLALQSAAIEKLNADLQRDLQQVKAARVLSKEVDFGEFSQIYPDKEACLRYLADLKWAKGYQCRKCGHEKYCDGREEYARRCTRCRYVESATANTILQKCKFSIIKAFYAVFLIYAHKGSYSSQELSRVLELRQGTCWNFSQKVVEAIRRRRAAPDFDENEDWTRILLDATGAIEEDATSMAMELAEPN
ncbi:7TM diverse intracellular signaling domain-containing protein [Hymenobacter jejuensis]|uniref:Chromosome partitioning protein ParA n=1 Tax=Hymenobacter jejuensis TaxID=2502781 RepID=A0A5B8A3P9_9BACT|nr:7TM diverse intracellular signaling domain-containing protein [Hymenobacter jejuensis]QDA61265.1 hypothetical protein FHG12_14695 [Hymenobacter jejuensis]